MQAVYQKSFSGLLRLIRLPAIRVLFMFSLNKKFIIYSFHNNLFWRVLRNIKPLNNILNGQRVSCRLIVNPSKLVVHPTVDISSLLFSNFFSLYSSPRRGGGQQSSPPPEHTRGAYGYGYLINIQLYRLYKCLASLPATPYIRGGGVRENRGLLKVFRRLWIK